LYKTVWQEYDNKLLAPFKADWCMKGKLVEEFPETKVDLDELIQKDAIETKKKELEKTIL